MDYLLEIDDLHTYFKTKKGTVKAVNGVSYRVEAGKTRSELSENPEVGRAGVSYEYLKASGWQRLY